MQQQNKLHETKSHQACVGPFLKSFSFVPKQFGQVYSANSLESFQVLIWLEFSLCVEIFFCFFLLFFTYAIFGLKLSLG